MKDLRRKRVKVILASNNFVYRGRVLEDTDTHITIEDSKTHNTLYLMKEKLAMIEVLEVGTYE